MNKIFGIGLGRTGTNSLYKAVKKLGFTAVHNPKDFNHLSQFQFASDGIPPIHYQFLDKRFPGYKFILTVRDLTSWLRSASAWDGRTKPGPYRRQASRYALYKSWYYDEYSFMQGYYEHCAKVLAYFKDRREDLLIMNIANGEGWEKLCPFLEKDIPDIPFPHTHRTDYKALGLE